MHNKKHAQLKENQSPTTVPWSPVEKSLIGDGDVRVRFDFGFVETGGFLALKLELESRDLQLQLQS